jgi:hypothetical protein
MTDCILGIWTSFAGPKAPRSWVDKKIRDPCEFRNLIFAAIMDETVTNNAPYRYRRLRNDINEEVFDLAEMLRLAKLYLEAHEVGADDEPDVVKFITGVELRLTDRTQKSPTELEVAAASDPGVNQ